MTPNRFLYVYRIHVYLLIVLIVGTHKICLNVFIMISNRFLVNLYRGARWLQGCHGIYRDNPGTWSQDGRPSGAKNCIPKSSGELLFFVVYSTNYLQLKLLHLTKKKLHLTFFSQVVETYIILM